MIILRFIPILLILILTSCGQPGPLYLPTKTPDPIKAKAELKAPQTSTKDN